MNIYKFLIDSLNLTNDKSKSWNDCVNDLMDKMYKLEVLEETLSARQKEVLLKIDDYLYVRFANKPELFINCSDFFHWACADWELIEDWELLCYLVDKIGGEGALLYCCVKRQMSPQKPFFKRLKEENRALFKQWMK
jgi:hypothetical protein